MKQYKTNTSELRELYGANNSGKLKAFDEWLDEVRIDAWERGHRSACGMAIIAPKKCKELHVNPLRKEN